MTAIHIKRLVQIFARPTTKPEWFWSEELADGVFSGNPDDVFVFIETLLATPGTELAPFTDDQVAMGLTYIFNGSASNLAHDFKSASFPFLRKEKAVRSLSNLFREVLAVRCQPKTSAMAQKHVSELNNFCYMFWDSSPMSSWLKIENADDIGSDFLAGLSDDDFGVLGLPDDIMEFLRPKGAGPKTPKTEPVDFAGSIQKKYENMDGETAGFYTAIAEVMRQSVFLGNPACVESGLHGLGHMATFLPKIAAPVIDDYLKNAKNQGPELIGYAHQARTGMIL